MVARRYPNYYWRRQIMLEEERAGAAAHAAPGAIHARAVRTTCFAGVLSAGTRRYVTLCILKFEQAPSVGHYGERTHVV